MSLNTLSIWRFRDGKPGHEQQTQGLLAALAERWPLEVFEIDVRAQPVGVLDWLLGRFPPGLARRRPDLLIGAGHATHIAMLAARRVNGGRAVVLMRPSLPAAWFDFIITPRHDGVTDGATLLATRGVLNAMRPGEKKPGSLLILLGGESKHARWDNDAVLSQIEAVVARQPAGSAWRLADSRRTPAGFSDRLRERFGERFQPWSECPPGWLAQRLAGTESVWVSEDSVSMVYEALSAGCRVGIIKLPAARADDRIIQGIEQLQNEGRVAGFDAATIATLELPAGPPLDEAGRAADWLLRALAHEGGA